MIETVKCGNCGLNTAALSLGIRHDCQYTEAKRKLWRAKYYLVNTYGFENVIDEFIIFNDVMHLLVLEEINGR